METKIRTEPLTNTFADVARQIVAALFADLPTGRRREVRSAVAHHIASLLPRDAMVEFIESLSETAYLKPGDRVKTLRGSTRGAIRRPCSTPVTTTGT